MNEEAGPSLVRLRTAPKGQCGWNGVGDLVDDWREVGVRQTKSRNPYMSHIGCSKTRRHSVEVAKLLSDKKDGNMLA